jgi:hexosaminidase
MNLDGKRHGGFYTQDDLREVVRYATARHITIVPEIDMPGHMQAAVASYPRLGCTDKKQEVRIMWGISHQILNPEDSTVQFCKDVLAEVMDIFPGQFIHVGGDEAKKTLWENNPKYRKLLKERGLKNMHEMQSWFIKQMDDFITANSRRLIGWDEIGEGGLASNAALMWWRGKPGQPGTKFAGNAAKNGHDVVIALNSNLYFDHYQSKNTKAEPLAIGGFLPLEKVYHFDPVIKGLTDGESKHVLGAQGQLWREYMPTTKHVEYMAFPRACALAELTWLTKSRKNYGDFKKRLKTHLDRLSAAGVNYRKLDK